MTKLMPVSAALAFLWACGGPEHAAVDQFFRAAKANDRPTLAYMSAVAPPVEAESWKVVEVSSRSTEPYTLPELRERFEAVEKERNALQEERQKFGKDNADALEQIIPKLRDDPEYKFRGKLGEIQAKWTEMLDVRQEKERGYQELKKVVQQETGLATKSVMRQLDVGKLKGDIAVTALQLSLTSPEHGELPFQVTLRKYQLTEAESDRIEPSRWVIVDFEGTNDEARAAAALSGKARGPTVAAAAAEPGDAPTETVVAKQEAHPARELRGSARVQILEPKTAAQGDEVTSTIRVRNASRDWISGFTVTEHWYDKEGNVVGSTARTHRERFMPGEVLTIELKTRKSPSFFQNQYQFSHANGDVNASVVPSFPNRN